MGPDKKRHVLCWPFELAQLNKCLSFWGGQIAELGLLNGTAGGGKGNKGGEAQSAMNLEIGGAV